MVAVGKMVDLVCRSVDRWYYQSTLRTTTFYYNRAVNQRRHLRKLMPDAFQYLGFACSWTTLDLKYDKEHILLKSDLDRSNI